MNVFKQCTALTQITDENFPVLDQINGNGLFAECEFKTVTLSKLTKIKSYNIFSKNYALEEVSLPELQIMEDGTGVAAGGVEMVLADRLGIFYDCSALKKVNLPKVYHIQKGAFAIKTSTTKTNDLEITLGTKADPNTGEFYAGGTLFQYRIKEDSGEPNIPSGYNLNTNDNAGTIILNLGQGFANGDNLATYGVPNPENKPTNPNFKVTGTTDWTAAAVTTNGRGHYWRTYGNIFGINNNQVLFAYGYFKEINVIPYNP